MAATLPPGIGDSQQASQATAFIRQQPWYRQWLAARGITEGPDQQVKLNDQQRAELMALSLKNGIGLNSKFDSIDENGQIAEEHHKLKKAAIAAAIGGLALTGFGAAGIGPLAGALAGGTAAAGAGGAAAAGIPTTAGIASATALGLPVTAGLGTAGAIGAGTAAAAAPVLASHAIAPVTGALVPATTSSLAAAAPVAGSTYAQLLARYGKDAGSVLSNMSKQSAENSAISANNAVNAQNQNASEAENVRRNMAIAEYLSKGGQTTIKVPHVGPGGQVAGPDQTSAAADPATVALYSQLLKTYRERYPDLVNSATTPVSPTAGNPSKTAQALGYTGAALSAVPPSVWTSLLGAL